MISYKFLIVTVLLVMLSYTGITLYTSVSVFGITVIATYICYTLNAQLRLEKYLKHLPFGLGISSLIEPFDEHDFQLTPNTKKHDGLGSFPKPIAKILEKYINSILQDFIQSWYVYLGTDEEDFIEEVRTAMEQIFTEINSQLVDVNIHKVTADLIRMFQKHIKTFNECQNIIQKKYPNLQENDFSLLISELYEEAVVKHIATRTKGAELDYLKTLIDIVLHKFVPSDTFSCLSGRFLLREILAIQMLEPLVKDITDPNFVNEAIIDILEPSVPLSTILKQWKDAMKEIEHNEEEVEQITPTTLDVVDISSPDTNYESTHEQEVKKTVVIKSKKKNRGKKSKAKSKTNSNTHSSSDHSDNDEQSNSKDMIRFDKLDTRTSNPVYGSTSARDHEKSSRLKLFLPVNTEISANDNSVELIDSGRASIGKSTVVEDNFESEDDVNLEFGSPMKEKNEWAVCPSSSAPVFRNPSFTDMPLKQDNLSEQIKAKVNSAELGNMLRMPIPCLDTCTPRQAYLSNSSVETVDHKPPGIFTHKLARVPSVDGSVTMEFSRKISMNVKKDIEKENLEEPTLTNEKDSDEIIKVHKSGADGAFYEIAPSCPTCIEMTLLASPFEIERAQMVMNEKERIEKDKDKKNKKIKGIEHECGLNSEHFCNAQAETESINVEPMDNVDNSFASCSEDFEDDEFMSDQSMSSGTLLASGETFEESENVNKEDYEQSSSFDNINSSSCEEHERVVESSVFDINRKKRNKKGKNRKLSRAASVATFKTAIEGSVIDEYTRQRSVSSVSLDSKSNIFDKQFFQFFKKGIQRIPSRKKKKIKPTESIKKTEKTEEKKRTKGKKIKKLTHQQIETSSISTSITKFNSLPENPSSIHSHWKNPTESYMKDLVEEEGLEVGEDENFHNNLPGYAASISTVVDPLSYEITVTDKDLMDVKSVKSQEEAITQDPSKFIPIYEGEVIMPHPSKIPAAWLYPIQMISIPSTEVAYEKGWEPGINKYTLYGIHYDIRIWPDAYQKHLKGANTHSTEDNTAPEPVTLIREIKRRYREFLFLHNRLTHGPLSKSMKGILRPNRRYAMPFGRMDPDVIEGRRKILETYIVSLVSRPELCNSREFKDFLGSEDHKDVAVFKPRKVGPKQLYKSQAKDINTKPNSSLHLHKENVERIPSGLNSQYFIHGYEVPRMFGFSLDDDARKHSKMILSHFVLNYPTFKLNKEVNKFEAVQTPKFYKPSSNVVTSVRPTTSSSVNDAAFFLGPRTDGDGAEVTAEISKRETPASSNRNSVVFDEVPVFNKTFDSKKHESSINQSIAAKFSEELAARLQEEKEHSASMIAREKDLYESSWPLTDSVLSIVSQILKGYGSWITFEKVQQSILFSLGGIIEWFISRELDEAIICERCYKYLNDLYYIVWDKQDNLRPSKPQATEEEKAKIKEKVLERVMEFIPSFIRISIGTPSYRHCCTKLVKSLQYQSINRHLLYAALEIILYELVPEIRHGNPGYVSEANLTSKSSI